MQSKHYTRIIYALTDFLAAVISWFLLFSFRKVVVENDVFSIDLFVLDTNFFLGLLIVPSCWVLFYFVTGTYGNIYRKSRLTEVWTSIVQAVIGSLVIFFVLVLDDVIYDYKDYYLIYSFFLSCHFLVTISFRFLWLAITKNQIAKREYTFPAIIIGSNQNAIDFYLSDSTKSTRGLAYIGYVEVDNKKENGLSEHLSKLGHVGDIESIIQQTECEDVIIAVERSERDALNELITSLIGQSMYVKIIPDLYDILSGSVQMNQIVGEPLIEIYPELMPKWQLVLKRATDMVVAACSLVCLLPFFVYISIRVKLSSKGPVFYLQERIGYKGKPFTIYKFRSMYTDAEKAGPALSSTTDTRITKWGKTMRKWRFDELPQFWNVLIGDMSLIGPRPERQYYIDQILSIAPHGKILQRVKPGITSLGMVKYGYAENVQEMVDRLKYDILYIENMSLSLDLKVFLYTLRTILQGRGK